MDPLSLSTSLLSIISLSIQITQILDRFARDWKDVPSSIRTFVDETNTLLVILQRSEEVVIDDTDEEFNAILCALKRELWKLRDALMISPGSSAKRGWTRILRALRADSLRQSMTLVGRHCEQVNQLVTLKTASSVRASRVEIQKLATQVWEWHLEAQFVDVLAWVSRVGFEERHADYLGRWCEGTGGWLLEEEGWMDWRNGVGVREDGGVVGGVLWFYGIPGAGKTTITYESMAIENLKTSFAYDDVAIAYVYCDYKNQFEQNAETLLASLVRQVTIQSKEVPECALKAYRKHANGANPASLATYAELLSQLVPTFRRCFLVVDALDEYVASDETPGSNKFLDELIKIAKCEPSCRILITSREDSLSLFNYVESTKIEITAKSEDVRRYVDARIRDSRFPFSKQVNKDPSFATAIIETLAERAHGQFLLPSLHINHLAEQISERKCKAQLKTLPNKINDLYEASFQRVKSEQPAGWATVGLRILSWVLHAVRPLQVDELRHALAIEDGDEWFSEEGMFDGSLVLGTTKGLITIQMDEIHFVHHTTKEYFSSIDIDAFPGAEKDMAQTCIIYLKLRDFEVACEQDELVERYQDYPFLRYACLHWGHHVTKSSDSDLNTEITKLLKPDAIPLGSLQVISSKVLNLLWPSRIPHWKLPQLQMAIVCDLETLVQELVTTSPRDVLDEKGYKQETALHVASRVGSVDTVKLLIKHGANVNATSYSGRTALDVIMGGPWLTTNLEIARLEDEAMIAIATRQSGSEEPFDLGNLEWRDLWPWIEENLPDTENGEFLTHLAAWQRNTSLVLDGGFEMDMRDEDEATVNILIENGVDVNSQANSEHSPLQLAAIYGRSNLVRKFLTAGADSSLTKEMGWTAEEMASKRGFHDIAQLLQESMQESELKKSRRKEAVAELSTPASANVQCREGDEVLGYFIVQGEGETRIFRRSPSRKITASR
ncbi:Ankyrin repeat-containing protein [Glarea lozoyensis ATCC 20868]|uniref:Ankyrin repeat-containing protein n=1 Tax=Glarea lozoyensis (strain ATCC 20868 / MF5171) TaxID=1116229 RepID=S3CF61_GLAL2|nr:Ankyrin repeat-containing protein [Glarea lozoyensis ATCC 20868]EPE25142.1 Ankyrin repeat-containing protein [Glarea lozoyensis ATCC 20868]